MRADAANSAPVTFPRIVHGATVHAYARQTLNMKYWMARIPLVWRRTDTYLEITFV
jgi:hypothetical protein